MFRCTRPTCSPRRRDSATACRSRSVSARRLGRPVSGSVKARRTRSSSARRRSVTSTSERTTNCGSPLLCRTISWDWTIHSSVPSDRRSRRSPSSRRFGSSAGSPGARVQAEVADRRVVGVGEQVDVPAGQFLGRPPGRGRTSSGWRRARGRRGRPGPWRWARRGTAPGTAGRGRRAGCRSPACAARRRRACPGGSAAPRGREGSPPQGHASEREVTEPATESRGRAVTQRENCADPSRRTPMHPARVGGPAHLATAGGTGRREHPVPRPRSIVRGEAGSGSCPSGTGSPSRVAGAHRRGTRWCRASSSPWPPRSSGVDGAYVRVHHFARQLASPFPLLAAIAARTSRIEIGTGVIDMRYENPLYMAEEAAAADLISGGRLQLGVSRGSPETALRGRRPSATCPPEGSERRRPGPGHDGAVPRRGLAARASSTPTRGMTGGPPGLLAIQPQSPGLRRPDLVGCGHPRDRRVDGASRA